MRCTICDYQDTPKNKVVHFTHRNTLRREWLCTVCIVEIYPEFASAECIGDMLMADEGIVAHWRGSTDPFDDLATPVAPNPEIAVYGPPRPPRGVANADASVDSDKEGAVSIEKDTEEADSAPW